jgi:hypothetical protein
MQVDLLQLAVVQEATETSHHPTVKVTVVLVLIPIDHVEISAEGPGAPVDTADIP